LISTYFDADSLGRPGLLPFKLLLNDELHIILKLRHLEIGEHSSFFSELIFGRNYYVKSTFEFGNRKITQLSILAKSIKQLRLLSFANSYQ